MDRYDEHAAIAGEAAGLRPEQWPGLAHILRSTAADEREACIQVVILGAKNGWTPEMVVDEIRARSTSTT